VLDPFTIGGLLIGGVLAAPLAAWLVTKVPAPVLGSAVGGIIILTNARTILRAIGVDGTARTAVYALIVLVWAAAVAVQPLDRTPAPTREAVRRTVADRLTPASTGGGVQAAVDTRAVPGRLRSTARATASL
jgi:uncharacterized protein